MQSLRTHPKARCATALLLVLQLGGCVADTVTEQHALMAFFCLRALGPSALEWAGVVTWLVLAFSWVPGLVALRLPRLRPVYWGLLLLIPLALGGQAWLLERGYLSCDGP